MDFLTWPEFFLSIIGVTAVFAAVTGLMILFATQLTQDDHSFFLGIAVPLVLASYSRGWEIQGIWVLLSVFAMLAKSAKPLQWLYVFVGIVIFGVAWVMLFNQLQGTILGKLVLPWPWIIVLAAVIKVLNWPWPKWKSWFGVVVIPSLLLCIITQIGGPDSFLAVALKGLYLLCALALAIFIPITLARRQPEDCGGSIKLGMSLTGGGAIVVLAMVLVHNAYFVR